MNAYSLDLRRRIFNYSLNHTVQETAQVFQIAPSTVYELEKLFTETGDLLPRPPGPARPRAVSPEGELFIQTLICETVDITLAELCQRYTEQYGVNVSISTMHATLQRLKISYKRKTTHDPKHDSAEGQRKTAEYHQQVDSIPLDQRLYLDEVGSRLDMSLPYGRAPIGDRAVDVKPSSPGETVSTLAVLSEQGLERPFSFQGELTAQRFVSYLEVHLLDLLLAGKTLILDRHPVHTAKAVTAYLDSHNIHYVFLPPYSPELNAIEEAWSKVKHILNKQKARTLEHLLEALHQAVKMITSNDAQGFLQHVENYSLVSV